MDFLRDYTAIQSLRYGNETRGGFFAGAGNRAEYRTLKFILQPIVENSYIHAFSKDRQGSVYIVIEGKVDATLFYLRIRQRPGYESEGDRSFFRPWHP
jgi:sensor histidine kinase YesM